MSHVALDGEALRQVNLYLRAQQAKIDAEQAMGNALEFIQRKLLSRKESYRFVLDDKIVTISYQNDKPHITYTECLGVYNTIPKAPGERYPDRKNWDLGSTE